AAARIETQFDGARKQPAHAWRCLRGACAMPVPKHEFRMAARTARHACDMLPVSVWSQNPDGHSHFKLNFWVLRAFPKQCSRSHIVVAQVSRVSEKPLP